MGRYYDIALNGQSVWSSYHGGVFDPGALNVQLDLLASVAAVPMGACSITIDGVALSDLLQAQQFAGMQISVRGGMGSGIAGSQGLANPNQAGLLLQGEIYQSFGNWVGTDQNLNFVVVPSLFTFESPGNFVIDWQPGQSLASALSNTLTVAYPDKPVVIQIGANYSAQPPGIVAYYHTIAQFGQFLKAYTKKQDPKGRGVDIHVLPDGSIYVSDGSTSPTPVQLDFTDLVGQPKWVEPNTLQFTTVMRADIQIGSAVKMPKGLQDVPGIVQTAAASLPSQLKYKTSFQGNFGISSARHLGNFRDSDGSAWVSVFQGFPTA